MVKAMELFFLVAALTAVSVASSTSRPRSYAENEDVELLVNAISSTKTLMPLDYYSLPFCQPDHGVRRISQNFGQYLVGDRIAKSPYVLKMKQDMYCEQLCLVNLGRSEVRDGPVESANKVVKAIRRNYHSNWIVDGLPAASTMEDDRYISTRYWQGFPIGFVHEKTKLSYIHNHINIEIMYHNVESDTDGKKYRVVRFTVEPFSIKHKGDLVVNSDNDVDDDSFLGRKVDIKNPIASCRPGATKHTTYEMIVNGQEAQLAAGQVLFTYDVKWTENSNLKWASRWDIYVTMDNAVPAKVHWLSILNSLVVLVIMFGVIVAIVIRNVRRDLARYSPIGQNSEMADWIFAHADVFRPPSFSPMLLAVSCGVGAQICATYLVTIVCAWLSTVPAQTRPGYLIKSQFLLFCVMGAVAGYVMARLYKTFGGKAWRKATLLTTVGLPGCILLVFTMTNFVALSQNSTRAVSLFAFVVLLLLWAVVHVPMTCAGSFLGFREDVTEFPVKTSQIPRQVPNQPWYLTMPVTMFMSGVLPFGSCFVELYYMMSSAWMQYYYNEFGFLFLVFLIAIVTCAEITILYNYYQLCNEDYRWWWRAFLNGGSTAIFAFLYSGTFFQQFNAEGWATHVFYFAYMALICGALFLALGSVGVLSALCFNMFLFDTIQIE